MPIDRAGESSSSLLVPGAGNRQDTRDGQGREKTQESFPLFGKKKNINDIYMIDVCCGLSGSPALRCWWLLPLRPPPPLNPCTCALVAIVVLAGWRLLALSFSILIALNGVAVTHMVPRTAAAAVVTTLAVAHALRAGRHQIPREGEDVRPHGFARPLVPDNEHQREQRGDIHAHSEGQNVSRKRGGGEGKET